MKRESAGADTVQSYILHSLLCSLLTLAARATARRAPAPAPALVVEVERCVGLLRVLLVPFFEIHRKNHVTVRAHRHEARLLADRRDLRARDLIRPVHVIFEVNLEEAQGREGKGRERIAVA